MRWIETYLCEVGRFLPAARRDDILDELRSSLQEQAQDLAGDQTPSAEHQQRVLDRMGHPLKVASGFDAPRYLIGPELFPTFVETLKTVLVVVALIQCGVMLTAYVSSGWTTSAFGLIRGLSETLLWSSAIVATVFVVAEYGGERLNFYDEWHAASLKPRSGAGISRGDLISNIVSEAVFLLWWNDVLLFQNWIPGVEGALTVTLTEVWSALYWPLNILFGAWLILHSVVLIRGLWHRATLWLEIVLGLAGVATAAWLLAHRPLVSMAIAGDVDDAVIVQRVVATMLVAFLGTALWDVFKACKLLRRPTAQSAAAA